MEIIAVLDLKSNQIVHAKRGERDKYTPPKSYLFETDKPLEIVNSIQNTLGIKKFYVADLDAITNKGDNFRLIKEIMNSCYGTEVYLDSGISNVDKAKQYLDMGITKVIIGSETLKSLEDLEEIIYILGTDNVIFSVDSMDGRLLSKDSSVVGKSIEQGLQMAHNAGVKNVILLELKKVGAQSGYDDKYLKMVQRFCNNINVYVGGGVRGIEDICELTRFGVKGIMTATAIYNGAINANNIGNLLV